MKPYVQQKRLKVQALQQKWKIAAMIELRQEIAKSPWWVRVVAAWLIIWKKF